MSNKASVWLRDHNPTTIVVLALAMAVAGSANAEQISQATTSRQAREDALSLIPYDKLTASMQTQLKQVVTHPSIYRRLPTESIDADPDLHVFLVRHPEIIVDIWRLMGASSVSLTRTGQFSVRAVDGMGTHADIDLVYGMPDLQVLYAEGTYEGPIFKAKVHARCVMLLKSVYTRKPSGKINIRSTLDIFVQFQNVGAALLAKALQKMVGQSVDYNFREIMRFIGRLSDVAEKNGAGVERLAGKLTQVQPDVRRRFRDLARIVHHRSLLREAAMRASNAQPPNRQPSVAQD
ncbi:MAG: hypothetical protein IH991_15625 [Planctomycetes bacterium]|nr:hypothetical protein [Planctomycetota bacterium]